VERLREGPRHQLLEAAGDQRQQAARLQAPRQDVEVHALEQIEGLAAARLAAVLDAQRQQREGVLRGRHGS
jgi:hypothetical protein